MKIRTVAVLAVPLAACLTMSAQAAPTKAPAPLVMTDTVGDGNGLNAQGFLTGGAGPVSAEGNATPADVAAVDIRNVTIAPTGTLSTKKVRGKKVTTFDCTGFTATIDLGAAPLTTGALYRITASATVNGLFWLEYHIAPGFDPETVLRYTDTPEALPPNDKNLDIAPVKIVGTKLVFTVTNKNLKAVGERAGHITLSAFGADIRANSGVITAPILDQLITDGSQSYKVCPL